MPEYLAPGVFVEETSFRSKSIEGVSTSVAGIVGPARYGPLRGRPEVVTSFGEFRRTFGDDRALALVPATGGDRRDVENHTAHAARAFFDNGGKQLYVVRTAGAVNEFPSANARLPLPAALDLPNGYARLQARFPGAYGNFHLEVRWRDRESLLQAETVAAPADLTPLFVRIGAVPPAAIGANPPAGLPANDVALVGAARARVAQNGERSLEIELAHAEVVDLATNQPVAGLAGTLTVNVTPDVARTLLMVHAFVRRPARAGAGVFPVALDLRGLAPAALEPLLGRHLGAGRTPRLLVGTCDGARIAFPAALNNLLDPLDPPPAAGQPALGATLANALDLPATLLAAMAPGAVLLTALPLRFDLDVRVGGADGEVVYTFADVALDPAAARNLAAALPETPARSGDAREMPVFARLGLGAIAAADQAGALALSLWRQFDGALAAARAPRFVVALAGGDDGAEPVAQDYAGESDEQLGSTGLVALEEVEDVSIVMAPAAAADPGQHAGVVLAMQSHCRKMRYRVGVVDSERGMSFNDVRDLRNQFSDDRLALYYPWVVVPDPNRAGSELLLPPAGFVAGTYARTDVARGVHKAPANEVVFGALRFEVAINKFQQELLNPESVNCLRSFPRLGHRIWGGRTLGADPEWRYVNVRRYFLFLERSIDKSTQWVVFEPNGERLWSNVRDTVEAFLFNEWKEGHLLGSSPKEAYFVRCDRTTMTQNDLDNGRLICLVGVAPLRPAEFVIFRVGQKTADA